MQFELTEEQAGIRKKVRDFAEEHLAQGVMERGEKELFSRELFNSMGSLGLTGICFSAKYGGSEDDTLSYVIAVEELSRIDAGLGVTLSTSVSLYAWPIYAEWQQDFYHQCLRGRNLYRLCHD